MQGGLRRTAVTPLPTPAQRQRARASRATMGHRVFREAGACRASCREDCLPALLPHCLESLEGFAVPC